MGILINAGADVNAAPAEYAGGTALQAAAGGMHDAILTLLIEAGVNVDERNYSGETVLHPGCCQNFHTLSFLLRFGVFDTNAKDYTG